MQVHKLVHKTMPNGVNVPELQAGFPNYLTESKQENSDKSDYVCSPEPEVRRLNRPRGSFLGQRNPWLPENLG